MTTPPAGDGMTTPPAGDGEELAAPLDLMLTDAALGVGRRLAPNSSWLALGLSLAARPPAVNRRRVDLGRRPPPAATPTPAAAGTGDGSCPISPPGIPRSPRPSATAGSPTRLGRTTRSCAG